MIGQRLKQILGQISNVYNSSHQSSRALEMPRLVAVSKTKPREMVIEAYETGQRHFGENYFQELKQKASDPLIAAKCPDFKWHFIGQCQANKVRKMAEIPNLAAVETISSLKLAEKFQSTCLSLNIQPFNIFIQVNTSGEESKGGIEPGEVVTVVKHIVEKCPNLKFQGLMTIGAVAHSINASGPNPDFQVLIDCRKKVADILNVPEKSIELSMGMSNDFEEAIRMGSTNIRIGSSIFGSRG